jgi:hypothetical protein
MLCEQWAHLRQNALDRVTLDRPRLAVFRHRNVGFADAKRLGPDKRHALR